jgi:hypothetical protein
MVVDAEADFFADNEDVFFIGVALPKFSPTSVFAYLRSVCKIEHDSFCH